MVVETVKTVKTVGISANWYQGGRGHFNVEIPESAEQKLRDLTNPDNPYVSISRNKVVISQMFNSDMKVADVYRYGIEKDRDLIAQRIGRDKAVWEECHLPTIVLLLESPHGDEYDKSNKPIAPAMGTTGRNLDNCLGWVLSQIRGRIFNGSRIIISNPVQFQTSLHMILGGKMNGEVKVPVWNALWHRQYVKGCFVSRMANYNPYLVINACTGGQDENGLKRIVTGFLKKKGICREIYEINHPVNWNISKLQPV